jgi:hypothetical protein
MHFLNEKYLSLLKSLINELENAKRILNNVKESGKFSDSKEIIQLYENLFSTTPLNEHVEFKISFIGKSTHSLIKRELSEDNANRHLTLNLISKEAIWIDQLYENRITDLLKFFKHLFSAIENFSIYQNVRKLEKFGTLIDEIKRDITSFVSVNIESDKNQPVALLELQKKESDEIEVRNKGVQLKSNWQLFVNVILDNGIEFLYHFTDDSNLTSIKEKEGLYSWAFCESNNINIPMPGGDSLSRTLDKRKGAENYVRFSFCKNHPMEYVAKRDRRIINPVKLLCDTELIYHIGTKFCNMNATKNEAIISDTLEYFQNIDFGICDKNYLRLNQSEKSKYQSEVLVYEHVPIKYILNIDEL